MASGFTTLTDEHLRRSNLWSNELKQLLIDDLCAMRFVKVITDFPDGVTFNIPSIGEAETSDFSEGAAIKYSKLDTGNFTFTFDQYKYSAHSISEKFKRDSYYSDDVLAAFSPRQHRALMEAVEARIFERGNSSQTASSLNTINGGNHRFVASGTNEILTPKDFALALYALQRALVPLTNLTAIIDPSAVYAIQTQAAVTGLLSPDQQWQSVVKDNILTGMKFKFNLYGFDVYSSNYLPSGIAETINARTTTTAVANMFFSATPGDTLPWIGGFRQMPTVHSEFNKDLQQTEYLTIAEYGFKVYRSENLVVVLSDTDQVS